MTAPRPIRLSSWPRFHALLDTRGAPDIFGTRSTPLTANETLTTRLIGTHGRCTFSADATTLVINAIASERSGASYLTVYRAGIDRPLTSNRNSEAGCGDVANAVTGPQGLPGEAGPQIPAGSGIAAEFFALKPPDNSSTVAVGAAANISQDGPSTSPVIARTGAGTFDLADIGVYRVTFQVSSGIRPIGAVTRWHRSGVHGGRPRGGHVADHGDSVGHHDHDPLDPVSTIG